MQAIIRQRTNRIPGKQYTAVLCYPIRQDSELSLEAAQKYGHTSSASHGTASGKLGRNDNTATPDSSSASVLAGVIDLWDAETLHHENCSTCHSVWADFRFIGTSEQRTTYC
jgi:hypothetical protein